MNDYIVVFPWRSSRPTALCIEWCPSLELCWCVHQDEDEHYPAAYQQTGSPGGAGAQYHQGSPQEEGLQEPEEEERGVGEQESQEEEDLADSSHLLDQEEVGAW